jgi:hypothetical protein
MSESYAWQIHLQYIVCNNLNEALKDEPYLQINGENVWSATGVRRGHSRKIDIIRPFNVQVMLDLWEHDPGPDDHIDAKYILYFTVSTYVP